MSIYSRRPKVISGKSRHTKLFKTDEEYVASLLKSSTQTDGSTIIRELVNEAIRIRRAKELGHDETLYAVAKKQKEVVHEGTIHLVEKVDEVGREVRDSLAHHSLTINDLAGRIALIERQTTRHAAAVNRLLEITVICYGILRHYVLGLFVVRLTKQNFQTYAEGFSKRLTVFRASVRAGNLLLEGDYEKLADDFARGITEATTVQMPDSDEEQTAAQKSASPVTGGGALSVPEGFPT